MALKFADTAKPMGLFPVAEAVDIELTKKDDSKKSLQAMYDDGELGGGEGLPLPEQAGMVMITYENEEGDLDWKQSLLKTVEKVDEVPTTFEDKVYVVDAEGTVTKIGYPLKNQNLDEIADFIKQKLIEIGATEDIVTVSLLEKGNYYILLDLEYDDTKYELMRKTYNDETGRIDIAHNIHMIGYNNNGYWDFDSPDKPHQLAWLTEYSVDLVFIDKNKKNPTQVFASSVELATKEYADTHGAGAQVYTQAEWNALPVKPAPGTQVIISDDTSGGSGGGGESGAIATVTKTLTVTFAEWIAQVTPVQLGVSDPTEYIWSVKSPHWEQVVYIDHVKSDFIQLRALEMSDSTGDAKTYLKKEGTITNVEFNGVQRNATTGGKDIYSIDEALTDKVWIDGKPIYRKVIQVDGAMSSKFPLTIPNIENVVKFEAYVEWNTNTRNMSQLCMKPDNTIVPPLLYKIESSGLNISIMSGSIANYYMSQVTIEYTKK